MNTETKTDLVREVLFYETPSKTADGFTALRKAAERAAAFLEIFDLAPPEHAFEMAKFKAFGNQISTELRTAIKAAAETTP